MMYKVDYDSPEMVAYYRARENVLAMQQKRQMKKEKYEMAMEKSRKSLKKHLQLYRKKEEEKNREWDLHRQSIIARKNAENRREAERQLELQEDDIDLPFLLLGVMAAKDTKPVLDNIPELKTSSIVYDVKEKQHERVAESVRESISQTTMAQTNLIFLESETVDNQITSSISTKKAVATINPKLLSNSNITSKESSSTISQSISLSQKFQALSVANKPSVSKPTLENSTWFKNTTTKKDLTAKITGRTTIQQLPRLSQPVALPSASFLRVTQKTSTTQRETPSTSFSNRITQSDLKGIKWPEIPKSLGTKETHKSKQSSKSKKTERIALLR